jgi:hypothetical protein
MVEDTGKTVRAGPLKPVNQPEPEKVEEDAAGRPVTLRTKRRQLIQTVDDRWRIDDEWWRREPVSRMYYAVRLTSGQKLVLYKDLIGGGWYRQSR